MSNSASIRTARLGKNTINNVYRSSSYRITGPKGDQGPEGKQGNSGAQGNSGLIGAQGPTGTKGDQGPIGLQGPIGNDSIDVTKIQNITDKTIPEKTNFNGEITLENSNSVVEISSKHRRIRILDNSNTQMNIYTDNGGTFIESHVQNLNLNAGPINNVTVPDVEIGDNEEAAINIKSLKNIINNGNLDASFNNVTISGIIDKLYLYKNDTINADATGTGWRNMHTAIDAISANTLIFGSIINIEFRGIVINTSKQIGSMINIKCIIGNEEYVCRHIPILVENNNQPFHFKIAIHIKEGKNKKVYLDWFSNSTKLFSFDIAQFNNLQPFNIQLKSQFSWDNGSSVITGGGIDTSILTELIMIDIL